MIRRALGSRGYQVDVAATLAEARAMDPSRYDAVLVDAHLGPDRGTDLVEALRSADPATARRCLVMTGGTADTLPDGVAYLAKPFQLGELINAVRSLHEPATAQPAVRHMAAATGASTHAPASVLPGGDQPCAEEPRGWQLLRLTRLLRARERHELVDFLHDSPIQELTAVTLELQMMTRSMPPAPNFDTALQRLNAAAGSLRWLVDGPWPFVEPETRLVAALQQRTAWLLAEPVTVDADQQAAGLGALEVPFIVDVVELMLLGIVTANPAPRAHVKVRADEHLITIELILMSAGGNDNAIGDPAAAQAALDGLASALEASVHARLSGPRWSVQVVVHRQAGTLAGQVSLIG
jgi:CheY-like chemotaxis protein